MERERGSTDEEIRRYDLAKFLADHKRSLPIRTSFLSLSPTLSPLPIGLSARSLARRSESGRHGAPRPGHHKSRAIIVSVFS